MQELVTTNFNRDFSTRNGGDFSCTLPTAELNQKVELVYQQKQKTIVAYISGKPVSWEFNPSKQFSIASLGTFSKLFQNTYGIVVTTGNDKVLYVKQQPSQATVSITKPLLSKRPLPEIKSKAHSTPLIYPTSPQINKAIYNNKDERQNLDAFEASEPKQKPSAR
jgi:hypothetical protein